MAMKSLSTLLLGQKSRSNMARERHRKFMKLISRTRRLMMEKSSIWSITMGGMWGKSFMQAELAFNGSIHCKQDMGTNMMIQEKGFAYLTDFIWSSTSLGCLTVLWSISWIFLVRNTITKFYFFLFHPPCLFGFEFLTDSVMWFVKIFLIIFVPRNVQIFYLNFFIYVTDMMSGLKPIG